MLTVSEIQKFLTNDKMDKLKAKAKVGQKYYDGDHDIKDYKVYIPDKDGHYIEDSTRSNIKISHPFFTELVDQATQYMLSGKNGFVFSDVPQIQEILDLYFNKNDDFMSELYDLLTGCQVKGFDYLYCYKDANDRLAFQYADALGVIEVRAKDTQDHCDYVIYHYIDRFDDDNEPIIKIQVWDKSQVYYYVKEGESGDIVLDDNVELNPRPHIVYANEDDNELFADSLGFIPFFRLDFNKKRISALKPIKQLIDDYDIMNCGLSNNLQDLTEGIFIVKNYQGENIDELIKNVKARKAVGVDSEGGLEVKTVDIPYQARQVKLGLDEDNIYRFGMGFNSQKMGDGNITNVVIKSRYALLDLKCNKLEIKLKQLLRKLVEIVLDSVNNGNGTAYKATDIYFKFEREMITNALDNAQIEATEAGARQTQINTLLSLAGVLDNDTVIQSICDVLDIDYESIKNKLPLDNQDYEDEIDDDETTERDTETELEEGTRSS